MSIASSPEARSSYSEWPTAARYAQDMLMRRASAWCVCCVVFAIIATTKPTRYVRLYELCAKKTVIRLTIPIRQLRNVYLLSLSLPRSHLSRFTCKRFMLRIQ